MRLVIAAALFAATACSKGSTQPHATGRLVFDTMPADKASIFLATEAEVMRSSTLLHAVEEQWRTPPIDPAAIRVTRHPDTMILEVTVTDRDPRAAADICNRVMQGYLERRLSLKIQEIQVRMQVLSEKLDQKPEDADLKRQLDELDTKQQMREIDARVLEPCTPPVKK